MPATEVVERAPVHSTPVAALSSASPRRSLPTRASDALTRPGWPLAAILVPFPLWWALGLTEWILFAMAVPMAAHLRRRRPLNVPRGIGWWLLFLLWVLVGGFLINVDAFGAVAADSPTRILTFGYRFVQYLTITVVLLYVINTLGSVSTARIVRMVACLFITITVGGLLGVLAPQFEFPSLAELVLPSAISNVPFIQGMIHPTAAQLQVVLGYEAARPSAPFSFSNTWGLNFALTLPFFLQAWLGRDAGWRRWFAGPILVLAAVPAVYSINRGMWGALVAMAIFVAVRAALTRRPGLVVAIVASMTAVALVVMISPLGTIVALRFTNEGSEGGRTSLGSLAVESVSKTSPIVGLGSTRDVQGNFNSISGGATAQCPACSPPSLGTQGQLWLVVFSQGLVGLALFAVFFALMFFRSLRVRSPIVTMGLSVMVAWGLTLPVYNSLGVGMLVVMIAVGLLTRERADAIDESMTTGARAATLRPLSHYALAVRAGLPGIAVTALLGLLLGAGWSVARPSPYEASLSVLLPESAINDSGAYPTPTLDTEAQMVAGSAVRSAVAQASDRSEAAVMGDLSVTATPVTRVLQVTFAAPREARARAGVEAAVSTMLEQRAAALQEERKSVLLSLRSRQISLISGRATLVRQIRSGDADEPNTALRQQRNTLINEAAQLQAEIDRVTALVPESARTLDEVTVAQPNGQTKINVASGFAAGGGLAAAWTVLLGPRLRRAKSVQEATGLVVLAEVLVSTDKPSSLSPLLLDRPVAAYLPVDESEADAVSLAERLNSRAGRPPDDSRSAVILVVTPRTRVQHVRDASDHSRRNGLDVVGLVLATRGLTTPTISQSLLHSASGGNA